jgi:hypothetical protein
MDIDTKPLRCCSKCGETKFDVEYHKKYKIEMPEVFICLFAKHLVAGTPLEPSLPLLSGNIQEEHG